MVPLLVLIVFLGVYPKPVLDRIEPSVQRVVARLEAQVERYDQPVTLDGRDLDREAIDAAAEEKATHSEEKEGESSPETPAEATDEEAAPAGGGSR